MTAADKIHIFWGIQLYSQLMTEELLQAMIYGSTLDNTSRSWVEHGGWKLMWSIVTGAWQMPTAAAAAAAVAAVPVITAAVRRQD